MVRGWLTVQPGATLFAPLLGLVDGWLTVDGTMHALHLTTVRTDLTIGELAIIDLPALSLAGQLILRRGAIKNLIALTKVRDSLTMQAGAQLEAGLLTRVGKLLTLRKNAILTVPALSYIGGYVDIDESARLVAPKFVSS